MFKTVVLGLDGSESSDKALAFATQLAREHGSKVHAVHVVELVAGRGGGTVNLKENELKAKIRGQVDALKGAGLVAELEMTAAMAGGPTSSPMPPRR